MHCTHIMPLSKNMIHLPMCVGVRACFKNSKFSETEKLTSWFPRFTTPISLKSKMVGTFRLIYFFSVLFFLSQAHHFSSRVYLSNIFSFIASSGLFYYTCIFSVSFWFFSTFYDKNIHQLVCVVRKTFRSYSLPRYLLSLSLFTLLPLFLSFSASSIFPSFFSSYHRDLGTFVFQGHTKNQGENQSVISAGKRDREREIEPWSSLS